jgi:hypothetical protein
MTKTIEAGPFQLVKASPYSRITVSLMDDNSVQLHEYSQSGSIKNQWSTVYSDITTAISQLDETINKYKKL